MPTFKLLCEMFSPNESMGTHAQILGNLCASHVMACHTRVLRSARNAAAAHKANHTMKFLILGGNAIGAHGAVALADAIKALLMMLCFLWNMTSILVTRMNTASLPT